MALLQFIIGTAGTGKTTRLMEEIASAVRGGGKAILLVPEQLSFESEKRLGRRLGAKLALRVEVLSFTRLCDNIFRALGGLADAPVTEAAKYLLMSLAAGEVRDSLMVYKKSLANTAFLATLVAAVGEFKTAGIPPERLPAVAEGCTGLLRDKLTDLAAVYGAYQALLERGYSDPADALIRASALLENNEYFGGFSVFVDGFTTFMAAEFELLGHVIAQSPRAVFAMTADGVTDTRQGMGVFSTVQSAVSRLARYAEERGVEQGEPLLLTEAFRFRERPPLGHVARWFPSPAPPAFGGGASGGESVAFFRAADRQRETEYVAAEIARLVREEGYRYREIAVVARDTDPYRNAMDGLFRLYGIPWFTDKPLPAENHPLVAGLLHAADAVRGNYATDAILLLAKSPLSGLGAEAVSRLENYCYCWGIRGAAWEGPFTANPRGLAGPLEEKDRRLLAEINETRAALIEPLSMLKDALEDGTGDAFAAGLFRYLEMVNAAENLTAYAGRLPLDEGHKFLNESALIWDGVMDILDVFGTVLGGIRLRKARLYELLRLALGTAEIGLPPQTLDQVLVGEADRIRPVGLRAVFVVGAVEGEFPAAPASPGIFSDAERRQLIDAGAGVTAPALTRIALERFFAYYVVTLASERLSVSWPSAGAGGQELLPSSLVAALMGMFPGVKPEPLPPARMLAGEKPAFRLLASRYGSGSELEATLLAYFGGGERGPALRRMENARRHPDHRIANPELAKDLFGRSMRLSPTRVERFYSCPFRYFAADGLALRPRQRVEFTPLESGSVIHNALQVMVQRHGGKGLAALEESALIDEIAAVIEGYLSARAEDLSKLSVRFRHLFGRLAGMLAHLLRRIGEEFAQSEFSPAAFELPIRGEDGSAVTGVEPLRLVTADGVPVVVEGVVDRVDIMEKNGRRYVRVVDYKSGVKSFRLRDILYGLNMQMLLYLFTIGENGRDSLADAIPAGVLYMPVNESFIPAGRDVPRERVAGEQAKQWRMSGILLEDEESLRGMERDLAGIYIPVKEGKSGYDRYSSLATYEEMGRLSREVRRRVAEMATALGQGEVAALPVNSDDYKTCEYCEFRAVCGHEPEDPIREIAKLDRAAVLKLLEEDDHG